MKATAPQDHQRAALAEERDLLLRSLEDLDAEYQAGDLDQLDYEALRDSYTTRAAAVLRQLSAKGHAGPAEATSRAGTEATSPTRRSRSGPRRSDGPAPGPGSVGSPRSGSGLPDGPGSGPVADGPVPSPDRAPTDGAESGPRLVKRLVVAGGLLAAALVAGFALAQARGERGVGDGLTGAVDPSSRTRVLECQALGSTGGDLLGALQCFDEILTVDPDNAEALTYRGWYLLLAAGSLQESALDATDAAEAEQLIGTGLGYLDRAIEADPELPDPLAFRATVYDRLGRQAEACADLERLRILGPPQFFLDQTADLAERNGC